jgi:hypothetical protein
VPSVRILRFPEHRVDGALWEPWLDEREVARHFGVADRTVRRWRAAGMPSKLFRGVRRYRLSQCEAWHEQREGAA